MRVRKLVALTLGVLTLMTLMASPAKAEHFGKRCDDVGLWRGGQYRSIADMCVMVNKRDFDFGKVEALADVGNEDPGAYWGTIEWRWDWVHIYKDGNFVEGVGPTGWMTGSNDSFSTDWIQCGNFQSHTFRAVARYQMRAFKNGDFEVTDWFTLSSATVTLCG